jgi:hypothetical protein
MIAPMELSSSYIWSGIFVIIVAYFYQTNSSKLLGEKKQDEVEDKNIDELIENKKRLLALNASPSSAVNLENILLQEAQWGSGTEINKIYETLKKYHYQTELSDIALSIRHFYLNNELKKKYDTLVPILAIITTHLCLFHLAYKKSKISPLLCQAIGIDQINVLKFKKSSCHFLQISDEQSDDRLALSTQIYLKLAEFPNWKDVAIPIQEIKTKMEQDK